MPLVQHDYTGGDGAALKVTPWQPDEGECVDLVVCGPMREDVARILAEHGLTLSPMPHRPDDLPTYVVTR